MNWPSCEKGGIGHIAVCQNSVQMLVRYLMVVVVNQLLL